MNTDNASKKTTEPKEATWKPLEAAIQGAAYGAILGIIILLFVIGLRIGHPIPPVGGYQSWQSMIETWLYEFVFLGLFGALVGLFWAKLPKRVGNGLRFLWVLAGSAVAFIMVYVGITFFDTSSNIQGAAIFMGVMGAGIGFVFALFGQFIEK